MTRFESKQDASDCLYEGFMGWDISEIFIVLVEWMEEVNDISEDIGDITIDMDESISKLLYTLKKEKENRIKMATQIRTLWKTGEYTEKQLSELFNIKEDTVHTTITNKNLCDVEYQEWLDTYEDRM